jgi:energy-coupling factor transport system permease protein
MSRVSPVSLLFASVVVIGCLIAASHILPLICLIVLLLVVLMGFGVGLGPLGKGILRLWPLLILTFVLHGLLSGHKSGSWGEPPAFGFNLAGLNASAFFTVRLIVILAVGMALFQCYPPQKYGKAVGQLLARLPFWRNTVAQADLTLSLSLQFVPFIEEEYHRLNMAEAARGHSIGKGLLQRLLARRRILLPLMVSAFRRADQTSLALQARGYNPAVIRTSLHPLRIGAGEVLLLMLFSLGCIAILWL